jgi:hypothetical protein
MIHVGVDLHQRFCYMTVLEASGKIVERGPVTNEKAALRKYLRRLERRSPDIPYVPRARIRSLSASPQKIPWTGTPVFKEGMTVWRGC